MTGVIVMRVLCIVQSEDCKEPGQKRDDSDPVAPLLTYRTLEIAFGAGTKNAGLPVAGLQLRLQSELPLHNALSSTLMCLTLSRHLTSLQTDELEMMESAQAVNLPDALSRHALSQPDAPAIISAVAPPITYRELAQHVAAMRAWLRNAGLGPQQRVAILLPNGSELAVAIATVTCNAVAVPLDPMLTRPEFLELQARVQIDAILTDRESLVPAAWSARHVSGDPAFAGQTLYVCGAPGARSPLDPVADPDSLAMILRSSGTTAQPKLITITHANLAEWADRIRRRLALTPSDRVLCVSPLYYAQGLETSLVTPLVTGGSLAFPPRPEQREVAPDLMHWLDALHPTWLSAGPTFVLDLLDRAATRGGTARHCLRFLQTGGSALPDATRRRLEVTFGVPVLEAYGMSEAGQLASHGWAASQRQHGTSGQPDAGQIAIHSGEGQPLPAGCAGEIVVRGPSLSPGYLDESGQLRPLLNEGWFHTGDLGFIDANGFLVLTGRRSEVINRGGEKISPLEIDMVLRRHPDVVEAAAFTVPHPRLGEDVAAAVVLRPGAQLTRLLLRDFLREHLTSFKVPHRIHIVKRLPKGATGKNNRQALTRKFAYQRQSRNIAPGSTLEHDILTIWKRLLGRKSLNPTDDFFANGGDSLLAVQMRQELEEIIGLNIPDSLMLKATTARQLGEAIVASDPSAHKLLVALRASGSRQPLVFADGDINGGGYYMHRFVQHLGEDRPLWLLRPFDATEAALPSIEAMASHYLSLMREAGLRPPYLLGGHCNGALVAMEVARQAEAAGDAVSLVAIIDPISLNARRPFRALSGILRRLLHVTTRDPALRQTRYNRVMTGMWNATRIPLRQQVRNLVDVLRGVTDDSDRGFDKRMNAYFSAMASYLPSALQAKLVCFIPKESRKRRLFAYRPWRQMGSQFEAVIVPGGHLTCVTTEATTLGTKLRGILSAY
jgi:oxalate---CoA ligase